MPSLVRLLPLSLLVLLTIAPPVGAQTTDLRQLYEQIHAANRLDATGQMPFHIKIAAQLYDLEGNATQTGMVEEWWAAGKYRIEVTGPGGKEIQTSAAADAKPLSTTRASFLLRQLLDESVNPLNNLNASATFTSVDRDAEGLKFRCLSVDWSGQGKNPNADWVLCTPPGSTDLRLFFPGTIVIEVRNEIARFHGVAVAQKTSRTYFGKTAITGEVKSLQSFDPATSEFPEFQAGATKPETAESAVKPTGVAAGHKISGPPPTYPPDAKAASVSGSVLLLGLIGKDGTMQSVEPIASASPLLTDAAVTAVKQWRYSPYLLNGKPTDVQTQVTVSFNNNDKQ